MPSYDEIIDKWRELSGCIEPVESLTKSVIYTYAPRMIETHRFEGFGRSGKDLRRGLDELWEVRQDPAATAYAFGAAFLAGNRTLAYIKGCLRNAPDRPVMSNVGPVVAENETPDEIDPLDETVKLGVESTPLGDLPASSGQDVVVKGPDPKPSKQNRIPKPTHPPKPKHVPVENKVTWKADASRFKFAPEIRPHHLPELSKRCISPEFALASGVRSAADNELRDIGFDTSLTVDQRKKGLQGICFAYCDPKTRAEVGYRIKPDQRFNIRERVAKYLSRKGDSMRAYFPHTDTPEMLADCKVPVIITEGELKSLSIAENMTKTTPSPYVVIGLSGVNGGWFRERHMVYKSDGSKEEKGHGNPKLIDDFDLLDWKNRRVFIVFDSDVGRPVHAKLFKQSKYSGAIGAEFTLAQLLRSRGSEVRIVQIPDQHEEKTGADDYISENGPTAFIRLLSNNWTSARNIESILYEKPKCDIIIKTAEELVEAAPQAPKFIVDKLLPAGGTAILAGAPKVGKSYLLLGLAMAVVKGERFLDYFDCAKGNVLYLQSEIPDWAMAQRIKELGQIPKGLFICTPGQLHLNMYEEDGFRKTPTENGEVVGMLVSKMKELSISLLLIDPIAHFSSLDENKRKDMTHLYSVIRMINRSAGTATLVAHHHRKTGGRQGPVYQGGDDMLGSISNSAETDSIISIYKEVCKRDNTFRLKMLFSTRHAEEINPREVWREGGGFDSVKWRSDEWKDGGGVTPEHDRKILDELKNGPGKAKELITRTRMERRTFFRCIGDLVDSNRVEKKGTEYRLVNGGREEDDDLPFD